MSPTLPDTFQPTTRAWFRSAFATPTPVQLRGWEAISTGAHALLLAPTGSGKTLAAFLWCLDRLSRPDPDRAPGVRVVYISPLKALANDIERNLRAPLAGLRMAAPAADAPEIRVAIRTGDTPQKERRRLLRDPAEILVTTPESLYLLLSSRSREVLTTVETIIVDEIHAIAGTKRGVHLALSLERLSALTELDSAGIEPQLSDPLPSKLRPARSKGSRPQGCKARRSGPQRIGLSATQRPLSEIASFLGGDREVEIIDAGEPPRMDLQVVVPIPDMENPPVPPPPEPSILGYENPPPIEARSLKAQGPPRSSLGGDRAGIWPSIHARIIELVDSHSSTIVFVSSRRLCERLVQRLNEMEAERNPGGPELARAHHGSVSQSQRRVVEEALKAGELRCIVATASLELGIDMGAVDLVLQVASPGAVSSALQRIGRADHTVGGRSRGRMLPRFRGELLECAAVAREMVRGQVEPTRVVRNALDVLAQQIVSMCLSRPWGVDELETLVRRSHPYRELTRSALIAVLDMLSGKYPLRVAADATAPDPGDFADLYETHGLADRGFEELRPRVVWDRTTDVLTVRRDARLAVLSSAGTIPDRGLFAVHLAPDGPRIGELDEEMVHESRRGEVFLLGASSWRIVEIKRDRVLVTPAPGEPGKMPFWRGPGPGRPVTLGRAMGALVREVGELSPEDARSFLQETCHLDDFAVDNLLRHIERQREETQTLPTDRAITVERYRDELGDWRICILAPLGRRVTGPWALALRARLEDTQIQWTDDGIVLRLSEHAPLPPLEDLLPEPEEIEDLLMERLRDSAVFAGRFREAAVRALLLTRSRPGQRTALWLQRLRSQNLLATAQQFPSFPIVLEAYRECLQDVFDLSALEETLGAIRRRDIQVECVETDSASPFARGLVMSFAASFLYDGDAPAAERRLAALTIDRSLLRELLGDDDLSALLDVGVIDSVEAELQRLPPDRRARSPDGLHDLLRRLGDLNNTELGARCAEDPGGWLKQLSAQRRVLRVRVAGEPRWIAVEDAGLYRDGLGVVPPTGTPSAFLEDTRQPFIALVARYARTHGPFTARAIAARWGLPAAQVEPALGTLQSERRVLPGAYRADLAGTQWCDHEVLRRIKRRTLRQLRGQVAPVVASDFSVFLHDWQSLHDGRSRRGASGTFSRLLDTLVQLEGYPAPFSELEGRILPARVPGFQPRMLDELGARGDLVWIGRGSLGPKDGRVALVRRDRLPLLIEPAEGEPEGPVHAAICAALERRGAMFLDEVVRAAARLLRERQLELREAGEGTGPLPSRADVESALWDLVWEGRITNDTFHPLRGLRQRKRRAGRRPRWSPRSAAGRWSPVSHHLEDRPADTERLHARAVMLLERYGVIGREMATAEGIPGGFQSIYQVLRAMESTGRVRRGWFVEGLNGAQFALPGAVDRLRRARDRAESPRGSESSGSYEGPPVSVLASVDPANPYGAVISWPEQADGVRSPRRARGGTVVLIDGRPALTVEGGSKSVLCFDAIRDPGLASRSVIALRDHLESRGERSLLIRRVDGAAAREAAHAPALVAAGFGAAGDVLELNVPL